MELLLELLILQCLFNYIFMYCGENHFVLNNGKEQYALTKYSFYDFSHRYS